MHVHVIPRQKGDFGENPDKIYKVMEIDSVKLKPRSVEDMANEAKKYREYFQTRSNTT